MSATVKIRVPETVIINVMDEGRASKEPYPMREFISLLLNTHPLFSRKGGLKTLAKALRIEEAFVKAEPKGIVEIEASAHEDLVKACEEPKYILSDKEGREETREGFLFSTYQARQCVPYMLALKDPVKE